MDRMECAKTRDRMQELLDGRLSAAEAAAARAHLEGCAECRRERELLSETWNLLLAAPALQADLLPGVRRRLRRGRLFRILAPLAAAAVLVLALAAGFFRPSASIEGELRGLSEEERALLFELAKDDQRELLEDLEAIELLEVIGAEHLSKDRFLFE